MKTEILSCGFITQHYPISSSRLPYEVAYIKVTKGMWWWKSINTCWGVVRQSSWDIGSVYHDPFHGWKVVELFETKEEALSFQDTLLNLNER